MTSKYSAVLLQTPTGDLLFHHRDNKPGISNPDMIGVFGGGVENGETFEQAAIREVKEELGFDISGEQLIFQFNYQKTQDKHGVDQDCKVFLVKDVDPSRLTLNPDEGQGIKIVNSQQNLDEINFTVMARDLATKYLQS
jgi:8-oxo-dGTP pyrophosphatase MutT (NUDIX family)